MDAKLKTKDSAVFEWYERTIDAGGFVVSEKSNNGSFSRSYPIGKSPLVTMFGMDQNGTEKPARKSAARVERENLQQELQRACDAADVMMGKKIAITQEEYDNLLDSDY